MILIYIISMPLAFVGIGFFTLIGGLLVLGIWVAYRILYGWKRLVRREPMPMS